MILLLALAQAVTPAPAPSAVTRPQGAPAHARSGVTSYGADFFAALRPGTALDMVQRIPGFQLDTGSSVRGYEGAAGNVLVDGQRPATKTDDLGELLKRIPAGAVDHIDVIRGGAPGIDMQGKTVIANVLRKNGGGARLLLAVASAFPERVQRIPAGRLEASGQVGKTSWEAALLLAQYADDGTGDGPRAQRDPAGKPLLLGDIYSLGLGSQVITNGALETPVAGGRLRINGRIYFSPFNYDETDIIRLPDSHREVVHADDNVFQTEVGARYTRSYGSRASIELVALRQDKHELEATVFNAPGDAETFNLDSRTAESIGRGVLKVQHSPTLSWEVGGEGAYNTLESQTRASQNGQAQQLPAANVTVSEKRGELFGKTVWRATPTISIEAGVRQEGSQISSAGDLRLEKSLFFTKPRVALTWAPNEQNQVRLRYERAVGQLDFGAFVAARSNATGQTTAGNPNLEPEQAWVGEAAYERRFWNGGAVVLTVRHSQITGVVDTAPFGGFNAPANIGDGTKDEEIVNLTLPLSKFGLRGAQIRGQSTWRQSEVADPTTRQKRAITKLRPLEWEAHFSQDLPNYKLNWGVDAYGMWRERYYRVTYVETDKLGAWVAPFVEWKPRQTWPSGLRSTTPPPADSSARSTSTPGPGAQRPCNRSRIATRDMAACSTSASARPSAPRS